MKEEQQQQQQHQHQHQYEGGDHMADLRHFFTTAPTHALPPPPTSHQTLFTTSSVAYAPLSHPYDITMMLAMCAGGGNIHNFHSAASATTTTSMATGGFDVEAGGGGGDGGFGMGVGGGDGGATARWPRQETLTLLEIRSRLDHKFKEANHKGPLWDEVSRILCEEHGYQRTGKKCREKFENLYKYYKKTKDGKAGRHDGKHYRFFRQLEALYGEPTHISMESLPTTTSHDHLHMIDGNKITNNIHIPPHDGQCNISNQDGIQSISLSNYSSSNFVDTSSSEGNREKGESSSGNKRRGRRCWKEKVKEFIDSQMRRIVEKQEAWLEKMVRSLEHKEQERVCREEEWRKQESERVEREHRLWAEERAWIEARDRALMDALRGIVNGKELVVMEKDLSSHDHDHSEELLMAAAYDHDHDHDHDRRKQQQLLDEEEISNGDNNTKKRKVNWRSKSINGNFQASDHFPNNLYKYCEMNSQGGIGLAPQLHEKGPMNESCLRMLIGDHEEENHLWDQSYGVKLNISKGETH